jgi:hypothetical protein
MVLQATTNTDMATAKANGATHALVEVQWNTCQTTLGGAVSVTATQTQIDQALALGLKVCLRVSPQYIPTFVDTAAVKFRRNGAVDWNPTISGGGSVRDWVWSASTRALLDDFLTKLFNQLTWSQIERVQLGGGPFGELSYPTSDGTQWWGFSAPAQTGTDLAAGQTVAPLAGHVPSTGTTWTSDDIAFDAWYRTSLKNFMTWLIGRHRAYFSGPIYVMHPGAGLRPVSQTPTSSSQALNYRVNVASGLDWAGQIAAYPDADVHPYSTWADSAHFWPPDPFSDVNDGNAAPWYHLLRTARAAGRANHIWGENTGNNTNLDMDRVFTDGAVAHGYQGLGWLSHSSLASGTDDTYANWASRIATANAAFGGGSYQRGINLAGAEFAADNTHLPGTYSTDYSYDSSAALAQVATRGHKLIRVPFRWERIQPTRNAALNTAELGRLTTFVSDAAAAGMQCILDVHNYARFIPPGGADLVLGDTLAVGDLVDLWTRLSTAFKGNAGVYAYGLMNEPHDLPGASGSFSGVVRYDWNGGTVAGWTGDTATATNVSNRLRLSATATTGYFNFRKDDAATLAGGALTGDTIQVQATLGAGITGNWRLVPQWQNSAFAWQSPNTTTYTRVDTGAVVGGLIAGVAVLVRATWTGGINSPRAFCLQTEANDATAGAVSCDFDDFSQGTLTGSGGGAQTWELASQQCVTAIRANSDTTKILVPGYGFSGAKTWQNNHPDPWITDSANNHAYEAHYYFDVDNSGDYPDSYTTENSAAVTAGYTNLSSRAARELGPWLQWLVHYGKRGFLGEMGWTNTADTASWNAVGETVYDECDRYAVDVTYWAGGARWGTGYNLSLYTGTTQTTIKAQATIVEAHPSFPFVVTIPPPPPPVAVVDGGKRTNRSTNPAAKNNSTGWFLPSGWGRATGLSGTLPRTTGIKGTSAPSNDIISPRCAVTTGSTYFTSFSIHYTNTTGTNNYDYGIDWYKADGSYLSSTTYAHRGAAAAGITERLEFGPAVAPTGATSGVLVIANLDSGAEITAHLFEQTTVAGRAYFDGDSTGPKATWTSTAGNSTSIEITAVDAWGWSDTASKTASAAGPFSSDRFGWSDSVAITGLTQVAEQWSFRDTAMVISLGYDERRGRVRINALGLDPAAIRAVVNSRPRGRGRYAPVRGGKVAISASGRFARIVDDYEFAAGLDIDYQIVVYASAEDAPDTIVGQAFATLPAIEPEVWLKFVAKPALNRRVTLTGWDRIGRQNRNAAFTVRGRPDPIVITDVHSSRTTTIKLRTESIQEGEALEAALSAGYPAFLHTPQGLALPTMYVAIGDVEYQRPSSYSHARAWTIDLIEVAAPPPSVFGPAPTWANIIAAYPTWRDVMDAFPTWRDVMDGNSNPDVVIAPPSPIVVPTPSPSPPSPPPPPSNLVYRSGPTLLLNSGTYRAVGANVYDLLDSSTSEAAQRLTELASFGVNTVRTWAFSNDGTAGSAMLARLDAALAVAGTLGIRLLLTLGNHYSDWGGPDKFGLTQSSWYGVLSTTWMAQVRAVVGRYVGNPNVFAWEILNEPRPNNDPTSMAWLGSVASEIKAVDGTHLVSSGSEGFVPVYYPRSGAHDGASPDINLTALNSGADIDIASVHFYSKYITSDYSPNTAYTLAAITAQKAAADALGKPLIVGEAGYDPADFGGDTSRRQFFSGVAAAMHTQNVAGGFAWNWGRPPSSSFTLSPGDLESETIMSGWVATLNGTTAPTIIVPQIGSGANDTYHSFDGTSTHTFNNTGNDVAVGRFDATQVALGSALRFTGVAIPPGATIVSAVLQLVSSGTDSGSVVNSKIRGVAADNAAIPANDTAFHAPGYTSAVVNWDDIPGWTSGIAYTSPNIKSIIQEIVNRPGWVSGNAVVLTWDDLDLRSTQSGAVVRRGQSYNNTPANAPKLLVRYV